MNLVFVHHPRDQLPVKQVYDSLKNDFTIWVDWEATPVNEEWLDEEHLAIDRADCVIVFLTCKVLLCEHIKALMKYCALNGKRIVPLLCENIDFSLLMPELQLINFVSLPELPEEHEYAMRLLRSTVCERQDYVKYHTRLLLLGKQWERHNFDKRLLLHKRSEVDEASQWLKKATLGSLPVPTTLHLSYVFASQANRRELLQRLVFAASFALLVGIGIVWPSWGNLFFMIIFFHVFLYKMVL